MSLKRKKAIQFIDERGILLVYPIDNRAEPESLWSCFHPRSEMRWEWDEGGDNRVSDLWHLREELARSREVVYAKWYQGRATFFSRDIFEAFLVLLDSTAASVTASLGTDARRILATLREDSPLSTKQLKLATDLRGKLFESTYERAMKELWSKLLIVGFGEVDEGAFPSLAVGATQSMFEDLWEGAKELSREEALKRVSDTLPAGSLFLKHFQRVGRAGNEATVSRARNNRRRTSPPHLSNAGRGESR